MYIIIYSVLFVNRINEKRKQPHGHAHDCPL